ncbi:hypothetical protein Tco_0319454 [Tanacetum coccineum]
MAPKRTPTSAAPAMSQAAIRKLVADSVAAALRSNKLLPMAMMTIPIRDHDKKEALSGGIIRPAYLDRGSLQITWSELKAINKKYCPELRSKTNGR